jgi:GST-like protein
MFEALAILQWLGDRFGVKQGLWPDRDDPRRLEAYSWCTWAYVTYGTVLVRLQFAGHERFPSELHNAAHAKLAREQASELLDLLEARLRKHSHMLGDSYSLVDLVVASVVGYGAWVGAPVDGHPRVQRWLEAFQARPCYGAGLQAAA